VDVVVAVAVVETAGVRTAITAASAVRGRGAVVVVAGAGVGRAASRISR
jgi:hypothetical protein